MILFLVIQESCILQLFEGFHSIHFLPSPTMTQSDYNILPINYKIDPYFMPQNQEPVAVIQEYCQVGYESRCSLCVADTPDIEEHKCGSVGILWCIVLIPCLICWLPYCI